MEGVEKKERKGFDQLQDEPLGNEEIGGKAHEEEQRAMVVAGQLSDRQYKLFHGLIFGVYMTNILGQDSIIPSMSVIREDLGFSSSIVALIASCTDVGMVTGKLIHGWLIDSLGPRRLMFYTALPLVIILLSLISFVGSATDPAEVCIIGNWCRGAPVQLAKGIWILGLSSRVSGLLAILLFAGLLRVMTWRWALRIACIFPLIGTAVTHFFLSDTPTEKTKPGRPISMGALFGAIKILFREKLFLRAVAVHSCSSVIRRIDIMLGPYYVDETGVSPEDAASFVIMFPLGVIIGLLAGGTLFRRLRGIRKRFAILGHWMLVFIGVLGLVGVAVQPISDASLGIAGACIFVLGVGISVPYYMAAYSYAALHGGKSIGLTAALIEALAFSVAAILYLVIFVVIDVSGWAAALSVLTFVALIGAFVTWFFLVDLDKASPAVENSEGEGYHGVRVGTDGVEMFIVSELKLDAEEDGGPNAPIEIASVRDTAVAANRAFLASHTDLAASTSPPEPTPINRREKG
ncbi:hypothetical protein AAMO2058_000788600 [Amorphochlora amoebiformis]